jgi:DNA-binding NtrC family response regulator
MLCLFICTTKETNSKFGVPLSLAPKVSDKARILIVCDDDSIAQRLNIALQGAGPSSERARTMTAGCALARSGRFHVVFTIPVLGDGSWRRLADIASQFDLGFVVVLVASNFDFNQCTEALEAGAFDVLDPNHELPKTAEAARCALWVAYLKGAGPCPEVAGSPVAA